MRRRVLGLGLTALLGCTLTTSFDGLSGGAVDAMQDASADAPADAPQSVVDGSTTDADADADAGNDGGLGPNLYDTGDFEGTHASACTGTSYNSNLSIGPARSGASGCVVCAAQGSDIYTLDRFTSVVPKAGERYRVTAWVKKYGNIAAPTGGVLLELRSARPDPFQVFEHADAQPVLVDDTWRPTTVDLAITQDAPSIELFVGAAFETNICFVVDDIELYRISN